MPEATKLSHSPRRKGLGLPELIAVGVCGMIGGGIFSVLGLNKGRRLLPREALACTGQANRPLDEEQAPLTGETFGLRLASEPI